MEEQKAQDTLLWYKREEMNEKRKRVTIRKEKTKESLFLKFE